MPSVLTANTRRPAEEAAAYFRRNRAASTIVAAFFRMWHIADMDSDSVLKRLRDNATELRAAGVLHLRLHGSVARGTASPESDIDLIADFDPARRFSLLDMVGIELRLSDLLGARVDLSPAHTLKSPVRERADREAMLAF